MTLYVSINKFEIIKWVTISPWCDNFALSQVKHRASALPLPLPLSRYNNFNCRMPVTLMSKFKLHTNSLWLATVSLGLNKPLVWKSQQFSLFTHLFTLLCCGIRWEWRLFHGVCQVPLHDHSLAQYAMISCLEAFLVELELHSCAASITEKINAHP